jgi:hypothetical protein
MFLDVFTDHGEALESEIWKSWSTVVKPLETPFVSEINKLIMDT